MKTEVEKVELCDSCKARMKFNAEGDWIKIKPHDGEALDLNLMMPYQGKRILGTAVLADLCFCDLNCFTHYIANFRQQLNKPKIVLFNEKIGGRDDGPAAA